LYDKPLSISNITFQKKSAIEQNMLLMGDTAGSIAPLCGNGMSMAMHTSFLASAIIQKFLRSDISRTEMNKKYARKWDKQFSTRIAIGRTIQHLFGAEKMTNIAIGVCKNLPFLPRFLIGLTHGRRF
jgi:flavin-dependent dehydrogenase